MLGTRLARCAYYASVLEAQDWQGAQIVLVCLGVEGLARSRALILWWDSSCQKSGFSLEKWPFGHVFRAPGRHPLKNKVFP